MGDTTHSTKRKKTESKSFNPTSSDTTSLNLCEVKHLWSIDNYSFFCKDTGEAIVSNLFHRHNPQLNWQLELYPNGFDQSCDDYVSLSLRLFSSYENPPSVVVKLKLGIMHASEKIEDSHVFSEEIRKFSLTNWKRDYKEFIKKDDLYNKNKKLLQSDTLKIYCEIIIGFHSKDNSNKSNFPVPSVVKNLCEDFEAIFENKKLSDVNLICKDGKVQAHKLVLMCRSLFFSSMEYIPNVVEIKDVEPEVLNEMLRFMYSAKVNNISNLAENLLAAAEKYGIVDLKTECEKFLCQNLSFENAVHYFEVADDHKADDLKNKSLKMITNNIQKFKDSPEITLLRFTKSHLVFEIFDSVLS